jgi:hypothetical protein
MPSRFARSVVLCNGGMDVRGAARKQPAFIVWGFPREGQTHSAKNAKPLLTTIHPFPVTLSEPESRQEERTQHFHFRSEEPRSERLFLNEWSPAGVLRRKRKLGLGRRCIEKARAAEELNSYQGAKWLHEFWSLHPGFPVRRGSPSGDLGLEFLLPRGAYVRNEPGIGSLVVLVIAASLAEAEVAVDCSADHICIPIILPVILPPANLAQLQDLGHR